MGRRRQWERWPIYLAGALCIFLPCGAIFAQETAATPAASSPQAVLVPHNVPLQDIPVAFRERLRRITEHPTLRARGPLEVFRGRMDLYHWLLDHPDRGVVAWRRLGAKCGDIDERGAGHFSWTDGQGSEIHWV